MPHANIFLASSAAMLLWACASTILPPKTVPAPTASPVPADGNDCAVMAAVAKGHYSASRDDPPVRATLDGAIAGQRWIADCDWTTLGDNWVLDEGPTTPPEQMRMAHVGFQRPRYGAQGALAITRISPPGATPSSGDLVSECRGFSGIVSWTAGECQPGQWPR